MRFEITAGPDAGKEIEPAGDRFTVGREDVDFLLADDEVSRRHFELRTLPDGRIEIDDLGSRNGTRVNGERLTGPRTLEGGEEIRVGVTTIVVEAPPPASDPGATKVSASPPPDPNATAAAAEIPPELRADEPGPGPDDATAPQPVSPVPSEPATPPPPSEPATPPPPPAPEPPTPAPTPPPPAAHAPPSPPRPVPGTPPPPRAQASAGLRTTALVLSIIGVLGGVFALIVVGVAMSLDLCDSGDLSFFEDCYDGSSGTRTIGAILSVLGAIASVAFLVFAIRYFSKSRNPQLVLVTGIATVLLIGIGLVVI
jgi:hypothetical protein